MNIDSILHWHESPRKHLEGPDFPMATKPWCKIQLPDTRSCGVVLVSVTSGREQHKHSVRARAALKLKTACLDHHELAVPMKPQAQSPSPQIFPSSPVVAGRFLRFQPCLLSP